MGDISKNFSYSEFTRSKEAESRKIANDIPNKTVSDNIEALVKNVLQPLRDALGQAMTVNSGYRCKALNEAVGGVPTSQHTKGEAADIAARSPYELARLAKSLHLPYDQMILYPSFVHFSHKRNGLQRNKILYNAKYRGKKL